MKKFQDVGGRIVAVFLSSALAIVGGSAVIAPELELWKSAVLAGFAAVATVVVATTVEVVVVEDVVDCSGMVGSTGNDVVVGAEEVVDSATVVVDTSVVVEATGIVLKASSGTISQSPSSIFQANIRQVPPPFSYMNTSNGRLPG